MKNILFFIESLGGGGAEKVLCEIVKNIDKDKFNITVRTITDNGRYDNEVAKYCTVYSCLKAKDYNAGGIRKLIYQMKYYLIYHLPAKIINLIYIKRDADIQIAFVEGYATKVISVGNKKKQKIAWVHVDPIERNYADMYFSSLKKQKSLYQRFEKIICVSNSVSNSFEKKFGLSNKIITIYNPINKIEIIKRSLDSKKIEEKKDGKLKFISVGRLEMQKGYDRLIEAFSTVSKESYELRILGEGSLKEKLESEIELYGLKENIYLLGFQENPYKYMMDADVFICSSRAEGYSLVIAEAMVLGLPIITTNCSGPDELVENGKYGIMVDNSLEGIRAGISQVINNEERIKELRELSKQRSEFFSMKSTINEIENILLGECI